MNRSITWALLLYVVVLGWLGWSGDAHAGRREHRSAMVVGMSDYDHLPPLHTASRDAKATAYHLKMTGFETTWTADPTKARLEDELEAFADELRREVELEEQRKVEQAHVALFYYSGHGRQVGDEMLLYSVDATEDDGFPLDSVVDTIGETGVDVLIVIIDACRTSPHGPGGSIGVDTSSSYERLDMDMFFVFSTSPGGESRQGTGQSLFTEAFNAHMLDPGTSVEGVASLASHDVYESSARTMVPWQYSSLKEPFYFVPGAERVAPGGPMVMAMPVSVSYQELKPVEGVIDPPPPPPPPPPHLPPGSGPTGPVDLVGKGRDGSRLSTRERAIVGLMVGGAGALAAGGAVLPYWWTTRNEAMRLVDTTPGYEEGTAERASYLAREETRARRYLIGSSVTLGVGAAMIATGTGLLISGRDGDRRARLFQRAQRGLGILLLTGGGVALAGGAAVTAGWWTIRSDADERADEEPGYEEGTEARRTYLAAQEQRARSYLYLGSAIAGGGAVAMVAGGVLVERERRRRLVEHGMASRVVPVVGRGYGGLSLVGRF